MIYVFGDHAVDLFLENYIFSIDLLLDDSGSVVDLGEIHGDSPLSEAEIARLKKFLVRNKVEFEMPANFTPDCNTSTVHFPDACYRDELKSMQYYRRIYVHETMLRGLIHNFLTEKYTAVCN